MIWNRPCRAPRGIRAAGSLDVYAISIARRLGDLQHTDRYQRYMRRLGARVVLDIYKASLRVPAHERASYARTRCDAAGRKEAHA